MRLADELNANPDTPTILFGHSHGGNVAHSALLRANTGTQIRGVVCLNTPFFTVLRRNVQDRLAAGFWFWVFGGPPALMLPSQVSIALFSLAAAVWMAGFFFAVWARTNPKPLQDRQEALARRLGPATAPYLCLTSYDDEAFASLSSVEAVCNLPLLLLSPWLLWPYMLTAVALLWAGVLPTLPWSSGGWWAGSAAFCQSVYVWGAAFYFSLFVLAYPAAILSFGLSQGLWDPLAAYLVRSIVTLAPVSAQFVEFREYGTGAGAGLAHSALYQDDSVCGEVVEWAAARLKKASPNNG